MVLNQALFYLPFYIPMIRDIIILYMGVVDEVFKSSRTYWRRRRILLESPEYALLASALYLVVASVLTIGCFVVVAQTIMQEQICVEV